VRDSVFVRKKGALHAEWFPDLLAEEVFEFLTGQLFDCEADSSEHDVLVLAHCPGLGSHGQIAERPDNARQGGVFGTTPVRPVMSGMARSMTQRILERDVLGGPVV
jgi:hypothetical protein